MTDNKTSNLARRRLLRAIGAGGGIIAASGNLPSAWSRPVVDAVLLPGHAQSTGVYFAMLQPPLPSDAHDGPGGIWNTIVSPAYAAEMGDFSFVEAEYYLCVTPNGNSAFMDLVILNLIGPNAGVRFAGAVPIGGGTVGLNLIAFGQACYEPKIMVQAELYSLAVGALFVGDAGFQVKFDLPMTACNLPGLGTCPM